MMEVVTLKNGAEEALPLVNVTMNSLQDLLDTGKGMIFYELAQLCRDRNHKLFGNAGEQLHRLGLIERHGDGFQVHDSIREIVLSAVEGEGLEMTLGNPIPTPPELREPEADKGISE